MSVAWTVRDGRVRAITAFPAPPADRRAFLEQNRDEDRIVPRFKTEAEEANWWFKNRQTHSKEMLSAARSGEARILTRGKLLARLEASKKPARVVSLRIPGGKSARRAEDPGYLEPFFIFLAIRNDSSSV